MFSELKSDLDNLKLQSGWEKYVSVLLPQVVQEWLGWEESREELAKKLAEAEALAKDFNSMVSMRAGRDSYLSSQEKKSFEDEAIRVYAVLDEISSMNCSFSPEKSSLERFEDLKNSLSKSFEFLSNYNEQYVEEQVEEHSQLFEGGNYSLNSSQREAVVRNDDFNQVIAGAGAGKTLVLTHRIAYLVEKGFSPDKIVAITLTNKAADEIERRLEDAFGIENVEVVTFHSFGYKFVDIASDSKKTIVSQSQKKNFIEDELKNAKASSMFGKHYRKYLAVKDSNFLSKEEFETEKEFVEARSEKTYDTIKGETVQSQGEKAIADFLFTHGIDYRHEALADWADRSDDKRNYTPDFYLPKHDIYIEHWGIDDDGEVPPWFNWSTERYKEKMEWGRQQCEKSRYELVETYDSEYREKDFDRTLEDRLNEKGVEVEPLELDEIVKQVYDGQNGKKKIKNNFKNFIETAKTFDKSPDELDQDLHQLNDKRKYHFGSCGKILLKKYETWLKENNYIDFQDLIHNSIELIEENPSKFQSLYDHVLVDEFQDVAMSQIKMIKALTGPESANLFCVGDDWQSIYGFRGAVVDYFVDFQDHFGEATVTKLTKNYRSQPSIVETGNSLIKNNPSQTQKELQPVIGGDKAPKIHLINGYTENKYKRNLAEHAAILAQNHINRGSDPEDIMMLSRLSSATNITNLVERELEKKDIPLASKRDGGVEIISGHSSKGRERKHVIVLHVAGGHKGFSPETNETGLMKVARDVEIDTEAEERRLFYVAITRAEDTLDIIAKEGEESIFIDEISEHVEKSKSISNPGKVGDKTNLVAKVDKLWNSSSNKIRQAGVLKNTTGSIKFVIWDAEIPKLNIKQKYSFENLKVSENSKGNKEIHINQETEINKLK